MSVPVVCWLTAGWT